MTNPERNERSPESVVITLTADGMIMVGAIKYVASRRQTELIRALGTAPGELMSAAEVNDAFAELRLKEASSENMQLWMNGMLRFSKGMFETIKEENRLFFRMHDHVSVVEEPPSPIN